MSKSHLAVIRHPQQAYPDSLQEQEQCVDALLTQQGPPTLILTEHPPTYTIGTSGGEEDILQRTVDDVSIAVYSTGRGGEVTYHGPGQLVCYVITDISRERDLHKHVWRLEEMMIRTLMDFGIPAVREPRGIGVWVEGLKIAAAGVRCRKWITWHGIALNIAPNLRHFSGIVPCGMRDVPVTSMKDCQVATSRPAVEKAVIRHATALF